MVLESEEHARARGARVYAYCSGIGYSADAHHITQPEPEGRGQIMAMTQALTDADITGLDVKHVNAHATSTPAGDVGEVQAVAKAIGNHPLVTSTKSMTGHLLGGAGGIESVFTIKALQERIVPRTINIDNLDDGIDVDLVYGANRTLPHGRYRRGQQLVRIRRAQRGRRV